MIYEKETYSGHYSKWASDYSLYRTVLGSMWRCQFTPFSRNVTCNLGNCKLLDSKAKNNELY